MLKNKYNSKLSVKAAGILAMIHLNSGQKSVGRFLESLGITLNDLNEFLKSCDEESLADARYRGKSKKTSTSRDKSGDKYYQPGGVD